MAEPQPEPERIVLLNPEATDDSMRRVELVVGAVVYRAAVFADGSLRLWDVRRIMPTSANSVLLEPFASNAARERSRQDIGDGWATPE